MNKKHFFREQDCQQDKEIFRTRGQTEDAAKDCATDCRSRASSVVKEREERKELKKNGTDQDSLYEQMA